MAIRITPLQQVSNIIESQRYVYKDLALDIQKDFQYNIVTEQKIDKNDILVSYDQQAIANSIRNLFTTTPGQRFLFPLYGLDLRRFLFEPINETTARTIGETITRAITNFEPRVIIQACNVNGYPDSNQYEIQLVLELPVFQTSYTINSVLDIKTEKFTFIN